MLTLWVLAAVVGYQDDSQVQQIDYVRMAYKANKEAFKFGTFEFEYTVGVSASASDARAGVFRRSIKEAGLYIFDGKNGRYELTADPKDIAAVTEWKDRRPVSSLGKRFRMLTDGSVTFVDSIHMVDRADKTVKHQPIIVQGTERFFKSFDFPLFIGDNGDRPYDLFSNLTAIKDGRATLVDLVPNLDLDGNPVCKVTFAYEEGKCTYWVDLSRGAVPLRIQNHFNQNNTDTLFFFSDLVQVPGAGWLPCRMLHIIDEGVTVYQLHVTKFDARNRPPLSAFQLEFPEPIGVVDGARKLAYSRRKTWSLLNLPSRASHEAKSAIPKTYIAPPDLPGEIESSPPWVLPSSLVLLAAGCFVWFFWRRRRRYREA